MRATFPNHTIRRFFDGADGARRRIRVLVAAMLLATTATTSAQRLGQFGPFDYYDPPPGALSLVERAHMGYVIKEQRRDKRWCDYWGSLDYTLRAFPNHPEALPLMAEFLGQHEACFNYVKKGIRSDRTPWELAESIELGQWRERTPDYYFQSAVDFRPNQAPTRALYGKYLYDQRRFADAQKQFREAVRIDPATKEAHYYLGLIYLGNGEHEKALAHAKRAYGLGAESVELRQQLIASGHWSDK